MSNTAFILFKHEFTKLCEQWHIPTPRIEESYDFENHTDHDSIAVHVDDIEEVDGMVPHIFGHYLADLHCGNPNMSDKVANLIAKWSQSKKDPIFLT